MSYQLPDLLGLLTFLTGDDDDGDLHINPLYRSDSDMTTRLISSFTTAAARSSSKSRLERRVTEFTREYNPGLLASTLVPFPSFPHRSDKLAKMMLQEATEWVLVCALVAEEVLRPCRVIDCTAILPEAMGGNGKLWKEYETRISEQSYSWELYQDMKNEFLDALVHIPQIPGTNTSRDSPSSIQEYVKWRTKIAGHKLLFDQYLSSSTTERSRIARALDLVLEIDACVTDLFAYNIHQAWHSKHANNPQTPHFSGHLNLVSFLMASDPEMTLQGAINCAGEVIRQRFVELKAEFDNLSTTTRALSNSTTMTSGLKSSLSSIISLLPSFGSSSVQHISARLEETPGSSSRVSEPEGEIRKVLLNWVAGTVHWAYEVEYFYPNVEGETSQLGGTSESGKKRGSEVRDYGWVFLIKE